MSNIHTRRVWYLRAALGKNRFNTQTLIKSTRNDLKLCKEDYHRVGRLLLEYHRQRQSQSTGKQENVTNPSFSTLELDSSQSMKSWGIRWNPLVEGINSRPSPSQIKKYVSKCSQNNELSQERKGKKQEREEHGRDSQKHLTNWILEDTRRLGPPFPTKSQVQLHRNTSSSVGLLKRT
jgi:hypothetical protein